MCWHTPGASVSTQPTFVLPNVYFHCSIAYALLRHAGVPLGKADFVGPIGQG